MLKGFPKGNPSGPVDMHAYVNFSNWQTIPGSKRPDMSKSNVHSKIRDHVLDSFVLGESGFSDPLPPFAVDGILRYPGSFNAMTNQALARFNGKLRKGSANLGVTIAQYKQSRDMIVKRTTDAANVVDKAYNRLKGDSKRVRQLRREREPLANEVLETEFGWRPFLSDMHAAMTSVCEDGIPPSVIKARGFDAHNSTLYNPNSYTRTVRVGKAHCTYAAVVRVSNPNLWLLNRLGLINPAVVLWDAIPWSFVVNMFVNVNQVVSQYTSEVGLLVTERSFTRTASTDVDTLIFRHPGPPSGKLVGSSRIRNEWKQRDVGTIPQVSWQVKLPALNWELALIASSLLVQKADRLNKLIRGL